VFWVYDVLRRANPVAHLKPDGRCHCIAQGGVLLVFAFYSLAGACAVSAQTLTGVAAAHQGDSLANAFVTGAITLASGLVLAATTGVVGYLWGRRRARERDLLVVWRNMFDRPAFRGSFTIHSNQEQFRRAIGLAIKAISTGKNFDTDGHELDRVEGVYHGPWQIQNPLRRRIAIDVRNRLQNIKRLSLQLPPSFSELTENDKKTVELIEIDRETVIGQLNKVWSSIGIETMTLPRCCNDEQFIMSELEEEEGAYQETRRHCRPF
jgi:hypothetical protein